MASIMIELKASSFRKINLLGINLSAISIPTATALIEHFVEKTDLSYITITNVHVIMECQRDPALKRILNRAALVTPDGMPLVWLCRLHGHKEVERVYGPDLLLAACEYGLEQGWRHYFYGGAEGVPELLAERLSARFAGLQVAGAYSPPFRPLTPEEDDAVVARINAAEADILWIGLGAPKQEYWMAAHLGRVSTPVMIGVGAAFDFHAGLKKQAPRWMQRAGLEWLFRLLSEPRRLWKRYLVNNPWFIWLTLLQLLGLKKFDIEDS